ncbi:ABC transporter permease [Brachybacterium sp. GPGPB12]|uniref:ABC transporter permease n=1 Tax=Brachybacterium sp. GPGPB12 TaxID=3023517 RepID=UPI00313430C6
MLSNGERLMVAIALPAMVMVGLWLAARRPARGHSRDRHRGRRDLRDRADLDLLHLAGDHDRLRPSQRRLALDRDDAPGARGYLAGKILATLTTHVLQVVVLGVLGLVLGWRPEIAGLAALVPVWLVGTVAFGALGLLVAGPLRTEAVLAVANLVFVLARRRRRRRLPHHLVPADPRRARGPAALGRARRADAGLPRGRSVLPGSAVVLLLWAAAGVAAVVRWFRWTDA